MNEEWRPVAGYEGIYELSSHGRIRKQINTGWKQINPYVVSGGYLMVGLHKFKKRTQVLMHRVVAEAFIGPIPDKMLVHHKDNDKTNNRKDNLEIVTTQDNTQRACDDGLVDHVKGEKHHLAKLKEADVIQLKKLIRSGTSQSRVASIFGISQWHVNAIMTKHRWKHIP